MSTPAQCLLCAVYENKALRVMRSASKEKIGDKNGTCQSAIRLENSRKRSIAFSKFGMDVA